MKGKNKVHHITSQNSSSSTPFLVRVATGHERLNKDEAISSIENRQSKIENPNGQTTTDHGRFPRIVVTLDAPVDGEGALARIPIAITGTWVRAGSRFSISLDDLEEIVRNFRKRSNGEINVDYDHASEMPEVAAGGPIPSAGRIVKLDVPESAVGSRQKAEGSKQGPQHTPKNDPSASLPAADCLLPSSSLGERYLLYGWYEPTDRARQLIKDREYRYISPAIDWGARSKLTGKPQGTTITSVALTNRPFLEELPQIRLSDPAWTEVDSPRVLRDGNDRRHNPAYRLVDVGEVHVDSSGDPAIGRSGEPKIETVPNHPITGSPDHPISKGGPMKQVKLSLEDGPPRRVRVAHDDFNDDYCADPQEMKDCLEGLGFAPADSQISNVKSEIPGAESLAEQLRELAGIAAPESGIQNSEAPQSPVALSECVAALRRRLESHAPGAQISLDQARALLCESEAGGKFISAIDYFRWRVEQELDDAVKSGKVLPRQRDDWRKIALSDFPTFRKIVAAQKTQVPLRPLGVSGPGADDAPAQVKLLAEQRMRERRLTFGQALSEIGREQPELVQQYRRAVSGPEM